MAKSYENLRIPIFTPEYASMRIRTIIVEMKRGEHIERHPFTIGKLEQEIKQFASENGIELPGEDIVMTSQQIGHILRDKKKLKGIAVSEDSLAEFPMRKSKMEIYYDSGGKKPAFVYFDRERNEKFVIHSDYILTIKRMVKDSRTGESKREVVAGKVVNYITATKLKGKPTEFNMKKYTRIK